MNTPLQAQIAVLKQSLADQRILVSMIMESNIELHKPSMTRKTTRLTTVKSLATFNHAKSNKNSGISLAQDMQV